MGATVKEEEEMGSLIWARLTEHQSPPINAMLKMLKRRDTMLKIKERKWYDPLIRHRV